MLRLAFRRNPSRLQNLPLARRLNPTTLRRAQKPAAQPRRSITLPPRPVISPPRRQGKPTFSLKGRFSRLYFSLGSTGSLPVQSNAKYSLENRPFKENVGFP